MPEDKLIYLHNMADGFISITAIYFYIIYDYLSSFKNFSILSRPFSICSIEIAYESLKWSSKPKSAQGTTAVLY